MKFNREVFYDEFKDNLLNGKAMKQSLVDGLNIFLDQIEKDTYLKSVYHLSYILATAWHETAFTMHPIKERGGKAYFISNYWNKTRVRNMLGNLSEYDAWARSGRGYVQLTGLRNDKVMTAELRKNYAWMVKEFEQRTGQVFDLVARPEQALDPKLAYGIIVIGMTKGSFTSKKLSDYISNSKHSFADYKEARRIVNGTDKATNIANYAIEFEKVLKLSLMKEDTTVPVVDNPIVEPTVEPSIDPIDEYPNEPKPGEAVPDAPAQEGQPIAGGRPTDEVATVPVEEAKPTSGLGAWAANIRAQIAAAGVSFAGLGSLFSGWITNPTFIKIVVGIVVFALVASLIIWIVAMIIKSIEKRAREKEAHELTLRQLEIKADPTKYNVVVDKPAEEVKADVKSFLGFKYSS